MLFRSDGTIKVTGMFGENSQLRFASDGTWERLASQSPFNDVKVVRLISWSAPSSMRQGVAYEIKGQIQPKTANTTVKLLINGTSTTTSVSDTEGKFTIAFTPTKVGIISTKLVIDGDARFAQTTSSISQILVR